MWPLRNSRNTEAAQQAKKRKQFNRCAFTAPGRRQLLFHFEAVDIVFILSMFRVEGVKLQGLHSSIKH